MDQPDLVRQQDGIISQVASYAKGTALMGKQIYMINE
jgi:hypothetical protein